MALELVSVTHAAQIGQSLNEFGLGAPKNLELAWDIIRRTKYWVHDRGSATFGPSKFVGFAGMNHRLYARARDGGCKGAPFQGSYARAAIESSLGGSFRPDRKLNQLLVEWAKALVGPQVFDGVDEKKWQYIELPSAPATHADADAEWSPWALLDESTLREVPLTEPGAYRFRAVDEQGHPRVIRRCFGDDHEGILGIGESKRVGQRLQDLLRCMRDSRQGGHMAGWRFAYLGMGTAFPLDRIQYSFVCVRDKEAAYELEGTLLNSYVRKHYEMPPLNYKFNWSLWDKERAAEMAV